MRVFLPTEVHPDRFEATIHTQLRAKLFKGQAGIMTYQPVEALTLLVGQKSLATDSMRLRHKRAEITPLVFQLLYNLVADPCS